MKNTATSTCSLYGYPGLQLLDSSGSELVTDVIRGGSLTFETVAESEVTLTTGEVAYFNIGYSDVTTGTTTCANATQMWVTPPNDTEHAVIPVSIQACNNGELHVSAVFGASSPGTQTTAP